jgi:hypothetical protein
LEEQPVIKQALWCSWLFANRAPWMRQIRRHGAAGDADDTSYTNDTSDATLIFFGSAMLLTALRGDAGCEILAPSNWLLRRDDQIACAVFTPFDALDWRGVLR